MDFETCVTQCLGDYEFVKEFNRLTGYHLLEHRSPINITIDNACGYDPDKEAIPDFIKFVYECIWIRLPENCFE